MTDETPTGMLREPLDITINLNPFFVTKTEVEISTETPRITRRSVKKEASTIEIQISPSCIACNTSTDETTYNIYTSLTENSRCLLSEFITKTSQIIFDRDKVWSEVLCKECFDLISQLDEAETEFLNLKNEFLVILKNNEKIGSLGSLKKEFMACQTQTEQSFPGKIEFCDVTVKDEFDDIDNVSMPASPMNVSDSDDEPLCKNKIPEIKKEKRIKIETTNLIIETLPEEFNCRDCSESFNNKSLAAVHAFTVHRIDCAKDPGVIMITSDIKPHRKRRSKKKSKRKSYAESDISNHDDEEWSESKPSKSKSKKSAGRTLVKPLKISLEAPKPFKTASQLQKKLQSTNLVIKKLPYAPHLKQPKGSSTKSSSSQSKKDKLTVMGHANPSAVLSTLQSAGLQVCSNVETAVVDAIKQPKDMIPCLECSAAFNTQARLDLHTVKAHMASKSPFICEICGASYKHKKACDIHVGMHKGISPWKCGVCAKIFPSKGALSRHEAIHTGKPNYQCDLCGKSFIHTSSFKMHKLSHTGVKPHSCNKCGLALMTRSHLKRHQRVHSGEKRHECLICGKKFSERYNLYAHHKSHESVAIQRQAKNHDCTMCEATFNRRYILEKHMETVHQRIMDTGPKRPRNTMTKLLKRQLLLGARLAAHDTTSAAETEAAVCEIADVKVSPNSPPPPIVHANTDSTSSTLIERGGVEGGPFDCPPSALHFGSLPYFKTENN